MKNFLYIILIGTLLLVLLFLFLVYPGMDLFGNIPTFFQYIFNGIIFIAILSYLVYLFIEIRSIYKNSAGSKNKSLANSSEEKDIGAISLDNEIDAQENYNLLTGHLLKLMQLSLSANTAFLYLYNKVERKYILQNYVSSDDSALTEKFKVGGSIYSDITKRETPKIYDRSQFDSTYLVYYKNSQEINSLMLVPVIVNEFVGIIGIDSHDKGQWDNNDSDLAQSFSNMFSQFIWQVDALELQSTQISFLKDIIEYHQEIGLEISMLEFFKKTNNILKKYFSYDKLTIFSDCPENKRYESKIEYIDGEETDLVIGTGLENKGGLPKIIADTGQIFIPDYDKSRLDFRFIPEDMEKLKYRSAIGKKVAFGDNRHGGIIMESFKPESFKKEDLNLLSFFCLSFDNLIIKLSKYKKAETLGTIDNLTQLYNRRAFIDDLKREIERSRRYDTTLTLLILDIDDFKLVNDNYGHPFGDFVLKKIAKILKGSVRSIDTVARYGGEEFTIILINADKKDCLNTAERIRSNIENFKFRDGGIEHDITVSIGFASFPKDGEDYKEILANADKAMYESKQAGKNQVTMYRS